MREQTRSNSVQKCSFENFWKITYTTQEKQQKIIGGFLAFAEYKRTVRLIYLLKIPIFRGMPKAKIPSITNLF